MAARGSVAKTELSNWLLEHLDGAFIASDGKTIRVPWNENGETIEVKVSLVAAKDLEGGGTVSSGNAVSADFLSPVAEPANLQATEEEKENVKRLMSALGL